MEAFGPFSYRVGGMREVRMAVAPGDPGAAHTARMTLAPEIAASDRGLSLMPAYSASQPPDSQCSAVDHDARFGTVVRREARPTSVVGAHRSLRAQLQPEQGPWTLLVDR